MKYSFAAFSIFVLLGAGCLEGGTPLGVDESSQDEVSQEEVNEQETSKTTMSYEYPGVLPDEKIANKQIRITTKKGDIVFTLFNETAPGTVSNFVYLTEDGYYDGLIFHRREESFVIQGGDPSGNGTGGPGYTFPDELEDDYSYTRGIVAMANRGPDTNGSQFFIMLGDNFLPKSYTIFGEVTEGLEVVDEIVIGDAMTTVKVEDR